MISHAQPLVKPPTLKFGCVGAMRRCAREAPGGSRADGGKTRSTNGDGGGRRTGSYRGTLAGRGRRGPGRRGGAGQGRSGGGSGAGRRETVQGVLDGACPPGGDSSRALRTRAKPAFAGCKCLGWRRPSGQAGFAGAQAAALVGVRLTSHSLRPCLKGLGRRRWRRGEQLDGARARRRPRHQAPEGIVTRPSRSARD